jgi:peptidoglycan/LPS O-acetylase OafA/YrhL
VDEFVHANVSNADKNYVESKYWPSLDGLRAVCIITVLASHLSSSYSGGFIGVNVFFVLSGFLITGKLLEKWMEKNEVDYGSFFLSRARRLIPALLATLVLCGLLWPVIAPRIPFFRSIVPVLLYYGNWTGVRFVAPLAPTWSLCIEEQFYLFWPFLFSALLHTLRGITPVARVTFISAGCLALTRGALYFAGSSLAAYDSTLACADSLLIGSGFALLHVEKQKAFWAGRRGTLIANACFMTLVVLSFFLKADSDFLGLGGFTLIGLYSVAIILHCVHQPAGVLSRVLRTSWLTQLGRRSYGLYLYHMPVFLAVDHFLPKGLSSSLVIVAKLTVSLIVCGLSYRFIERPFLRKASARAHDCIQGAVPNGTGFRPKFLAWTLAPWRVW